MVALCFSSPPPLCFFGGVGEARRTEKKERKQREVGLATPNLSPDEQQQRQEVMDHRELLFALPFSPLCSWLPVDCPNPRRFSLPFLLCFHIPTPPFPFSQTHKKRKAKNSKESENVLLLLTNRREELSLPSSPFFVVGPSLTPSNLLKW